MASHTTVHLQRRPPRGPHVSSSDINHVDVRATLRQARAGDALRAQILEQHNAIFQRIQKLGPLLVYIRLVYCIFHLCAECKSCTAVD